MNAPIENFNLGTRRLKILAVDPVSFLGLFSEGFQARVGFRITKGAPKNCTIMAVTYDASLHGVIFVVTSPDFEEVPVGQQLPVLPIELDVSQPTELP